MCTGRALLKQTAELRIVNVPRKMISLSVNVVRGESTHKFRKTDINVDRFERESLVTPYLIKVTRTVRLTWLLLCFPPLSFCSVSRTCMQSRLLEEAL